MYKLARHKNAHLELSLKKKPSFFSFDLLKGLLAAFGIHLFLFFFFELNNPVPEEKRIPLNPCSVEVDLQGMSAKTAFSPLTNDLSFSPKSLLLFPAPQHAEIPTQNPCIPEISNIELDFSDSEKIIYKPVIEKLSLSSTYLPYRMFILNPDKLALSKKTLKLLEKALEKKGTTKVSRLLYKCTLELGSGRITHLELKEHCINHKDAVAHAEAFLKKIKFNKGKGKEIKADIELWLEQADT